MNNSSAGPSVTHRPGGAERLEAAPTALYRHVATKDDVVDLVLDRIFGEVELPGRASADWRQEVRSLIGG